jgi:hypothetical protein
VTHDNQTTRRQPKSYWQRCVSDTPGAQDAIRSWFSPLSEGMTPYQADILCDIETDAEKKFRAFMTDARGKKFEFTRSRHGRDVAISMKPIAERGADAR